MSKEKKQTTKKGLEIPVPEREKFFENLKKASDSQAKEELPAEAPPEEEAHEIDSARHSGGCTSTHTRSGIPVNASRRRSDKPLRSPASPRTRTPR